jgi:hypothetical protein
VGYGKFGQIQISRDCSSGSYSSFIPASVHLTPHKCHSSIVPMRMGDYVYMLSIIRKSVAACFPTLLHAFHPPSLSSYDFNLSLPPHLNNMNEIRTNSPSHIHNNNVRLANPPPKPRCRVPKRPTGPTTHAPP